MSCASHVRYTVQGDLAVRTSAYVRKKMRNHLTLLEVCLKMGFAVQQMNLEMKDSKAIR